MLKTLTTVRLMFFAIGVAAVSRTITMNKKYDDINNKILDISTYTQFEPHTLFMFLV